MHASHSPSPRRHLATLPLLAGLAACATQASSTEKLPFHLAIAPASIVRDATTPPEKGHPTELVFAIDEATLTARLTANAEKTFVKVTALSPAAANTPSTAVQKAWVTEAQQKGADLLLVPRLRYNPRVHTELNDRFWLNLPLFALGGPFCWFVADRSYHCNASLAGEVHDVTAAAGSKRQVLDRASILHPFKKDNTEASLSFLQRASGAGPYLLSVLCPAGLLATESAGIPPELDVVVVAQLCDEMTKSLREGATVIQEAALVDFFPRDVHIAKEGGSRALVGEFVLKLGTANELGKLRYRVGSQGEWRDAAWSPLKNDAAPDRKVYPFAVKLDGATADTVQLQVEQLDQDLTRRTFTYAIGSGKAP